MKDREKWKERTGIGLMSLGSLALPAGIVAGVNHEAWLMNTLTIVCLVGVPLGLYLAGTSKKS